MSLHLVLTAVHLSPGNFVSLVSRIDGVCILIGCNFAGQHFYTGRTITGSGIMLIREVLSVLTNEKKLCLLIYICIRYTSVFACVCVCVCRSRQAWPSWGWSSVCCHQTWTQRLRSGRNKNMILSARARVWPAWPTTCTFLPGSLLVSHSTQTHTHGLIMYLQLSELLHSFQSLTL